MGGRLAVFCICLFFSGKLYRGCHCEMRRTALGSPDLKGTATGASALMRTIRHKARKPVLLVAARYATPRAPNMLGTRSPFTRHGLRLALRTSSLLCIAPHTVRTSVLMRSGLVAGGWHLTYNYAVLICTLLPALKVLSTQMQTITSTQNFRVAQSRLPNFLLQSSHSAFALRMFLNIS